MASKRFKKLPKKTKDLKAESVDKLIPIINSIEDGLAYTLIGYF